MLVLVVDDDPISRGIVGFLLRDRGHKVMSASDGAEALAVLERSGPDLILMDIEMPVMGGLEAVERIRAMERFCRMPILAVTSCDLPYDPERLRILGLNGYVSKPVDFRSFFEAIEPFSED